MWNSRIQGGTDLWKGSGSHSKYLHRPSRWGMVGELAFQGEAGVVLSRPFQASMWARDVTSSEFSRGAWNLTLWVKLPNFKILATNSNVFKILCEPNQTHLSATSLQPPSNPYIAQLGTWGPERLGDVPWPGYDWMAGLGGQKPEFPEPSPGLFSLYPVVIPEPHRASGLLEWKLVGDVWPHQVWPLLYFSHPELSSLLLLLLVKVNVPAGQSFKLFPGNFLAIYYHHLLLLTTCLDLPGWLTLQWDCSGNPLPSKLMSIPGETCSELSVQELGKYFTWKATVQSF